MSGATWTLRDEACERDIGAVVEMARGTGFFRPDEVDVAEELIRDRVEKGRESWYRFVFAEREGGAPPAGFVCFGPIACTKGSWDLYWIVVARDAQGGGLGRALMGEAEARVRAAGGRAVYVETSSKEQYLPTRRFYEACGYSEAARLTEFYDVGDDKVVYVKRVG